MPSPLETATALLDRETVAGLGDTFTYTAAGGSPVTGVLGFVDYGEDAITMGSPGVPTPGAIGQIIAIELLASLFPERPNAICRVTDLDRYPGDVWQPIGVVAIDKGFWQFGIKRVVA